MTAVVCIAMIVAGHKDANRVPKRVPKPADSAGTEGTSGLRSVPETTL